MSHFDPQVDLYIDHAAPFAQPILKHLRRLIHQACPGVEECIKWSYPHFYYRKQLLLLFTSHKKHCAVIFGKGSLMKDERIRNSEKLKAQERFMGRITKLADLPGEDELLSFIVEAMILNETNAKVAVKPAEPKTIEIPTAFLSRLEENQTVKAVFDSKTTSYRKEYITWIAEAKTEKTRQARIDQAMEWIAQGKARFWKYLDKGRS